MQRSAIVIGAGIAGLACALELCDAGLSVTVLEKGRIPGGRARSWTDPRSGDVVDIGPHILLSEYRNMLRMLERLGTADRIVWQEAKFLTLVGEPRPVDIYLRRLPPPLHFLPCLLALPQVSLRDLLSNRRVIWQVARLTERDIHRLDAVDAETYLRSASVTSSFIDWFWRSVCMAIMNVPLERCSAGALLRFFRFMVGRNGYRVGFAGTGLGELFVPGAVACIEAAGGKLLLNGNVTGVKLEEHRCIGVQLGDGRDLEASVCIAAIPPQEFRALLPGTVETNGWSSRLERFRPSPYISSFLWFDRKLTREKFWTRKWTPGNLTYDSYDLSNIRPDWSARPSVIASNIIYSERAAHLDDEQIVARTIEELAEFLPDVRNTRMTHSLVNRIPMAVPAAYPGSEALRVPNRTPVRGLLVAGDWTQTGLPSSMEGAVFSGYRAAEEALAMLGIEREIAVAPPRPRGLVRLASRREPS